MNERKKSMEREQIVSEVRDWLDANDWNYEYDAEYHYITSGITCGGKFQAVRLLVAFSEYSYSVYTIAPLACEQEYMDELNRYMSHLNFTLQNGYFSIDMRDGEIRYKIFVNCDDLEQLPDVIIRDSILLGALMMNKYETAIAGVALGFSDAKTEIKKLEGDDDDMEDTDDDAGAEE